MVSSRKTLLRFSTSSTLLESREVKRKQLLLREFFVLYSSFVSRQLTISSRFSSNTLMTLRKIVCHPYLHVPELDPGNSVPAGEAFRQLTDASAKLLLLERMLPKLREKGHKVLIVSLLSALHKRLFSLTTTVEGIVLSIQNRFEQAWSFPRWTRNEMASSRWRYSSTRTSTRYIDSLSRYLSQKRADDSLARI